MKSSIAFSVGAGRPAVARIGRAARRCLVLVLLTGALWSAPPWVPALGTHRDGISVMVLRPGRPAEKFSTGQATPGTNYRLASVTKQMTAAAVLSLVDAGKLTLDGKLSECWPEFPASITVRHLLTHQAGLVDYEEFLPPGTAQVRDGDVLAILRQHPEPKFAPGSRFAYSNSGYVLLAQMVEKISGRGFGRYLAETFFQPLQMDCVAHQEGVTTVKQRAYGQPKDQSRTSATLGDGGVYCSLDGMEKWLISRFALDERMLQAGLGDYGMGWYVQPDRLWHTGTTTGFRNAVLVDRRTHTKVVVLANRSDVDALKVAAAVLGALRW